MGGGAVKKMAPVVKRTVEPDGKVIKSYSRRTYWECKAGTTTTQTQLSFCVRRGEVRPEVTPEVTTEIEVDTAGGQAQMFKNL